MILKVQTLAMPLLRGLLLTIVLNLVNVADAVANIPFSIDNVATLAKKLASGEDFPTFREFWLERPSQQARAMKVYALLDSQSLTGAYEFVVRPGERTVVGVKARLFERKRVKELGIAPLTNMFFFGEQRPPGDWRP
jgi:glucan biosynthesis protein